MTLLCDIIHQYIYIYIYISIPVDARWANPNAFVRPLGEQRIGGGGGGGGGQFEGMDLDLMNMNEEDRVAVMQAMREFQRQGGDLGQGQGPGQGGRPEGNLDPNLPLMQLFLQTLLPWNDVRRG